MKPKARANTTPFFESRICSDKAKKRENGPFNKAAATSAALARETHDRRDRFAVAVRSYTKKRSGHSELGL
jgi:hypothetical protein